MANFEPKYAFLGGFQKFQAKLTVHGSSGEYGSILSLVGVVVIRYAGRRKFRKVFSTTAVCVTSTVTIVARNSITDFCPGAPGPLISFCSCHRFGRLTVRSRISLRMLPTVNKYEVNFRTKRKIHVFFIPRL